MLDRSCPPFSTALLMATYMVGTPGNSVGRYLSTAASTPSRSKRGRSTRAAPRRRPSSRQTVSPYTWKKGSTAIMTSRPGSASGNQARTCSTLALRLAWLSITPLETPVVPPVYWSRARSWSASTSTSSGAAGAEASASRQRRTGSSLPMPALAALPFLV